MFSTLKSLALVALVSVASADYIPDFDGTESVCGADQAQASQCVKNAEPTKYQLSQAVARIRTKAGGYCTAWLWGSEGHLVTNNHCIGSDADANGTIVELGSECPTCADPNNGKKGACIGTFVANSTTLVITEPSLDFAMVKLNLNPGVDLSKFGYLQSRAANATVDEAIYILGHPRGKAKHISFLNDDNKAARITNTSMPSLCGETDTLGYNVDTEPGNSGSPILAVDDNKVVALHNCGGCKPAEGQNTGNKLVHIVALLKSKNLLPKDAVAGDRC